MSSTSRGGEREASDYYVTPIDQIELFLTEWAKDEPRLKQVRQIFDPCAGGTTAEGKLTVPMSYPAALETCGYLFHHDFTVETMDIRRDSPADIDRDYLDSQPAKEPDLIITNPPFSIALAITQRALTHVAAGGFVVMLQRLNWLGSEKRSEWFKANMPSAIYVHAKRMGFKRHLMELPAKERNATDSIEYAHFVWSKNESTKFSSLRVI